MKSFRVCISILLVGITILTAQASSFTDTNSHPQEYEIEYLYSKGIISGYSDGSFKPNNLINRAELMRILVGATGADPQLKDYNSCFPDVQTDWYAPYVCYAKSKGWVDGYPDGNFKPADQTNRAEAIKMLVTSQEISIDTTSEDVFTDVKKGDWFAPYIKAAKDNEILIALGNYYSPATEITRGEISGNIFRAISEEPLPEKTTSSLPLQIWANEGGDKVTQDELRAYNGENVYSNVWDGEKIQIFGAKNEVVNFNLVLESPNQTIQNLEVEFNQLQGPDGATISSTGKDLFNWTNRNIELFYVRYLEIKGLSAFLGHNYDQHHLPEKMRAPYDEYGIATGGWEDRPNHNKFYPEIAVPMEIEQNFTIQANENQSIWADIYIPKDKPAGLYTGEITINSDFDISHIPVQLKVYDFELPDEPNSKTMISMGYGDINNRYFGEKWLEGEEVDALRDKHFMLAHRHKISLIDSDANPNINQPKDSWLPRLSGALFTANNGYDGPGANTGNNVYSIGTYGSWSWQGEGKAAMQENVNEWEQWFQNNFPTVEHFLYLIDESSDYEQIEQWSNWIQTSPGVGRALKSMATVWVTDAFEEIPSLDIPTSGMYVGDTQPTQNAVDHYVGTSDKEIYFYNGGRPGQGSFVMEDDGVALRELAWGQYKKNIDRWFYWESTYYNNFQAGEGETNVYKVAKTFGGGGQYDDLKGETGWNYSNGDGVMFYPGTDLVYPDESYDLEGPIASLRLKYWRRGIQDVDYLTLAAKKDPQRVNQIVQEIVPKVLWEYGVNDPNDPTWVRAEISWSANPDIWENARRELAEIISQ